MDLDCISCGACCAYDADWPTLRDGDPTPPEWVEDGRMRWAGGRCVALSGEVGQQVRCGIYDDRPQTCRDCAPASVSCHVARRHHGLPVEEPASPLDALLSASSTRERLAPRGRTR